MYRLPRRFFMIVGIATALAACEPADPTSEYAEVRNPWGGHWLQRSELHPPVAIPFPDRGVVVSFVGLMVPGANWTIVDLDRRTISVIDARRVFKPDRSFTWQVTRKSRSLNVEELRRVVHGANKVWNASGPETSNAAQADSIPYLTLFDGATILTSVVSQSNPLLAIIGALAKPLYPLE